MSVRIMTSFVVAIVLGALPVFAEIRETPHMETALSDLRPGDIGFVDIDNTAYEPQQMFGSDQWSRHYVLDLEKEGKTTEQAYLIKRRAFIAIGSVTKVRLLEKDTPTIIAKKQAEGV